MALGGTSEGSVGGQGQGSGDSGQEAGSRAPLAPLVRRAVVLRAGAVVHDGPPPPVAWLHDVDPEHAHPPHGPDPADAASLSRSWGLP